MANIKVDPKYWDHLPDPIKASVFKHLSEHDILKPGDAIVATAGALPVEDRVKNIDSCGAYCDEEARGVFIACMQSPDTTEELCSKVAARAFHICMDHCEEDKDDEDEA